MDLAELDRKIVAELIKVDNTTVYSPLHEANLNKISHVKFPDWISRVYFSPLCVYFLFKNPENSKNLFKNSRYKTFLDPVVLGYDFNKIAIWKKNEKTWHRYQWVFE